MPRFLDKIFPFSMEKITLKIGASLNEKNVLLSNTERTKNVPQ